MASSKRRGGPICASPVLWQVARKSGAVGCSAALVSHPERGSAKISARSATDPACTPAAGLTPPATVTNRDPNYRRAGRQLPDLGSVFGGQTNTTHCSGKWRLAKQLDLFSASPGPAQRDLPGGTPGRSSHATRSTRPQIGHDGPASGAAAGLRVMTKLMQGMERRRRPARARPASAHRRGARWPSARARFREG